MNILIGLIIFLFSFVLGKIGKFFIVKKAYGIKEFDFLSFLITFVLWEPFIMFLCYVVSIDFKRNKEERLKELTVLNQFTAKTRYELVEIIYKPQYLYFMFEREKDEMMKKFYEISLKIKYENKINKRKMFVGRIKNEINYKINNLSFT